MLIHRQLQFHNYSRSRTNGYFTILTEWFLRGFLLYKQKTLEEVTTTQSSGVEVQCEGLTPSAGGLWKQLQNGWVFLVSFQLKEVSKKHFVVRNLRSRENGFSSIELLGFY